MWCDCHSCVVGHCIIWTGIVILRGRSSNIQDRNHWTWQRRIFLHDAVELWPLSVLSLSSEFITRDSKIPTIITPVMRVYIITGLSGTGHTHLTWSICLHLHRGGPDSARDIGCHCRLVVLSQVQHNLGFLVLLRDIRKERALWVAVENCTGSTRELFTNLCVYVFVVPLLLPSPKCTQIVVE